MRVGQSQRDDNENENFFADKLFSEANKMTNASRPGRPAAINRYTPLILLSGDVLALLLFVYLGQRQHDTLDLLTLLLQTAAFTLPWVAAGWLLGAFSGSAFLRAPSLLARSTNTWFVAAPLGLLLRAIILDRVVIPVPFFITTLGIGAIFVLGWRLAFALIWRFVVSPSRE